MGEPPGLFLYLSMYMSSHMSSHVYVIPRICHPMYMSSHIHVIPHTYYLPTESYSSQISLEGGAVISETATMATHATRNAGSSS